MGRARAWHLLTFFVAAFAVIFQLVLVVQGHNVLDEVNRPDLGTRLVRFVSYFTILSNLLIAFSELTLAAAADRDTRAWRVLRLNAIVCIAVTGLVHWFFLRPLLDLAGEDWWADKLLHVIVPLLAVAGWLAFGPRGRLQIGDLAPSAIFPALYMVYTLVRGELVEWYPYPFTDVNLHGYPVVLLNAVGVIALLFGLSWAALKVDPKLAGVVVVDRLHVRKVPLGRGPNGSHARNPDSYPRVPGAVIGEDERMTIEPDTKDWTWVLSEQCPECGFDARTVDDASLSRLFRANAVAWRSVLSRAGAAERPAENVWSPLEYACHVRDVHRIFRERLQLMLKEDDPTFANWDQDQTAIEDDYGSQDPAVVSGELVEAAELVADGYAAVAGDQWQRLGTRSNGSVFTIDTLGRYHLHDAVHHLYDVKG